MKWNKYRIIRLHNGKFDCQKWRWWFPKWTTEHIESFEDYTEARDYIDKIRKTQRVVWQSR